MKNVVEMVGGLKGETVRLNDVVEAGEQGGKALLCVVCGVKEEEALKV